MLERLDLHDCWAAIHGAQYHRGGVATGHTPTPSHFPANFRAGGGGGVGLGGGGGLGPAEGEGGTRTPTYTA